MLGSLATCEKSIRSAVQEAELEQRLRFNAVFTRSGNFAVRVGKMAADSTPSGRRKVRSTAESYHYTVCAIEICFRAVRV